MIKKIAVPVFLLFSFIIFASGCETAKGVGVGVGATAVGATVGAAKDTQNTYSFIQAMDRWIKKNLW